MLGFILEEIVSLYDDPNELETFARNMEKLDDPIVQRRLQALRTGSQQDVNGTCCENSEDSAINDEATHLPRNRNIP